MNNREINRTVAASARGPQKPAADVGAFRRRHLALAQHQIMTELGRHEVTVDESESPLAWLARRRLIEPAQLQAGERLRMDFTRAHMMPRTTSNWESPIGEGRQAGGGHGAFSDSTIAARQRVRLALDAVGPEFAGLLLDVCCFLKGLEDVERERQWPRRSAKIVLQLALDRLARHYGYAGAPRGAGAAAVRTWLAEDAVFVVE